MEFVLVGTQPSAACNRDDDSVLPRLREKETGRSLSFSFIFGGSARNAALFSFSPFCVRVICYNQAQVTSESYSKNAIFANAF